MAEASTSTDQKGDKSSVASPVESYPFPDDERLLTLGRLSVLYKDRREQLERVQKICTTMMTSTQAALRDCEAKPPQDMGHVLTISTCLDNLRKAREKLVTLCLGIKELEE